jgi:MFS family permease
LEWTVSQIASDQEVHDASPPASPRAGLILTLLCVAQFMVILDVTVVNVALPAIGRSFSLGREALTWVVTGYTLAFGGLLILGGRLADALGRKGVFLAGLTLFTAASLSVGLATNGAVLLTSRVAQGTGAALLSPAALSIITTEFVGEARNRALAVWGIIGGAGAAIGVLLGGALTSGLGWRSAFFINVPVGLAVGLLAPRIVPGRPRSAGVRVDVPGTLAGAGSISLLI